MESLRDAPRASPDLTPDDINLDLPASEGGGGMQPDFDGLLSSTLKNADRSDSVIANASTSIVSTAEGENDEEEETGKPTSLTIEVPVVVAEDVDDEEDRSGDRAFVATPTEAELSFQLEQGSPGHTPYPRGVGSAPPVPFNSPDDGMLEEILKREARRQERDLQHRLGLGGAGGSSLLLGEGMIGKADDLDPVPSKRVKDELNDDGGHGGDRECARRARFAAASDLLRQLVPGLEDKAVDKTELLEMTAKYIVFLKAKVGGKYDRDFLAEYLPY